MNAPAGLYLSKILYPEMEEPATRGDVKVAVERTHANAIDAASAGASVAMPPQPPSASDFFTSG